MARTKNFKRRSSKPDVNPQQQANGENAGHPNNKETKETKEMSGMIFMCTSLTQEDCFKYHVFGLPEAKKVLVEQVQKGMKLFLFNVEEKLLYGIYKATSVGGMNLVKDAFKDFNGKFPAQVRFRVVKECAPLEESTFKQAIIENYFGRSKFNPELSFEQVQKLVQLFRAVGAQGATMPKPKKNVAQAAATKKLIPRIAPGVRPARAPATRVPVALAPVAPAAAPPYSVYPRERPYEGLPLSRKSEAELLEAENALYQQLREVQQARVEARLAADTYLNAHDPYATPGLPKPVYQDPYRDLAYPVSTAALHDTSAAYPYDRYQ